MKTIYYLLMISCLVVLLIRLKSLPRYCLWFVPIIFLAIIVETVKDFFFSYKEIAQRIYQGAECLLVLGFFNNLLRKEHNRRLLLLCGIGYVVTVVMYYAFYIGSFNLVDYFDYCLQAFLICVFVCVFFFELLGYRGALNLMEYPAFWINATNFIFYGGCFFAMAMYSKLGGDNKSLGDNLRLIPHYLNILLYSAYLIVFLQAKKRSHV